MSMIQEAAFPYELDELVSRLRYKQGWSFRLLDYDRGQASSGLTLLISVSCEDSYHPGRPKRVNHPFPVPPAAYNRRNWQRWLLGVIIKVESHEACEFYRLWDPETETEVRPYAPNHGPGHDPYTIRELATDEERRTSFTGEVKSREDHEAATKVR